MNIPSKLQSGQPFKTSIVRKINQVIDYLKTQKIVGDRNTITVNQGVNGVMLSAKQSPINKAGKPGEGNTYYVTGDGYLNYFKCLPIYEEISSSSSSESSSSSSQELPKIIAIDVIDGGKPEGSFCGITDIGNVNKTRINISSNDGNYIVLNAVYQSGNYLLSIQTQNDLPLATQPKFLIAELTNEKTKLIQRWQGGYIYFGSRFFI